MDVTSSIPNETGSISHNSALSSAGLTRLVPTTNMPLLDNKTAGNNGTEEVFYGFYQTEQVIFLIVLFVFIMVGNISVLVAILLSKNRKSRMNFFIMQLAIADLSTGFFSVLTDIIWKVTVEWYAGNVGCKVVKFMMSVVTYGSTYVLVALSIDRLDAIARPMSFTGSGLRAKLLVISAWVAAVAFSIPMLFINEEMVIERSTQCWMTLPETWHWKLNITIHALLLFLIPTIIIACCYSIIVMIIWSKASPHVEPRQIRRFSSKAGKCNKRNQPQNGEINTSTSSSSSRGVIPKARVKTIKMTFVIVLVFVICWSPYFVFDLLDVYGWIPNSQEKVAIAIFINSLCPLNSAANPVIYCLFSTKICNNWRRVSWVNWLLRTLNCCQNKDHSHGNKSSMTSEYTLVDSRTVHSQFQNQNQHNTVREFTKPERNQNKTTSSAGTGNGNGRRISATPFVRTRLSAKENDILMRNLSTNGKSSSRETSPVLMNIS